MPLFVKNSAHLRSRALEIWQTRGLEMPLISASAACERGSFPKYSARLRDSKMCRSRKERVEIKEERTRAICSLFWVRSMAISCRMYLLERVSPKVAPSSDLTGADMEVADPKTTDHALDTLSASMSR